MKVGTCTRCRRSFHDCPTHLACDENLRRDREEPQGYEPPPAPVPLPGWLGPVK